MLKPVSFSELIGREDLRFVLDIRRPVFSVGHRPNNMSGFDHHALRFSIRHVEFFYGPFIGAGTVTRRPSWVIHRESSSFNGIR